MEACTAQTGLLRKKPCGEKAVTKCGNCEQPLCGKHAVRDMSAGKKAGFLCQECAKAWKESEKTMGALPSIPAAALPPAAPAAAKKPAEPAKAAPAAAPATKAPAPKAAPVEKRPEPAPEHSGPLEFTPAAAAPAAKPAPPPEKKPEPPPEDSGPLEFTPEPKKPEGAS